jgi:branched-chain amino acid transport system substrate-binding protein
MIAPMNATKRAATSDSPAKIGSTHRLRPLRWLLMGLACLLPGTPSSAEVRTVKIGIVLPYSGGADVVRDEDRAMQLYVKLHENELGDTKLELIKRDSKEPSGATARELVRELIVQDNVDILLAGQFSPDAIASAPVVTQAKKPMILVNAQASFITSLSPYIVRTSAASWQLAYPMGEYAYRKLGCRKTVVGYADFAPGHEILAAFKGGYEKAGGTLADAVPMGGPAAVPDYTPYLRRIRDQNPDCVYMFTPGGTFTLALARTYQEQRMAESGIKFLGTGDITQDSLLGKYGAQALGWISGGQYNADLDNPENQGFVASWQTEYGKESFPDYFAVQSYDAMAAAFQIIKSVPGKIDGDRAIAALKGWKHMSPRGPIVVDPATRDVIQNVYVQKVVKKDGRYGMETMETIPSVKDPCKELAVGPCKPK